MWVDTWFVVQCAHSHLGQGRFSVSMASALAVVALAAPSGPTGRGGRVRFRLRAFVCEIRAEVAALRKLSLTLLLPVQAEACSYRLWCNFSRSWSRHNRSRSASAARVERPLVPRSMPDADLTFPSLCRTAIAHGPAAPAERPDGYVLHAERKKTLPAHLRPRAHGPHRSTHRAATERPAASPQAAQTPHTASPHTTTTHPRPCRKFAALAPPPRAAAAAAAAPCARHEPARCSTPPRRASASERTHHCAKGAHTQARIPPEGASLLSTNCHSIVTQMCLGTLMSARCNRMPSNAIKCHQMPSHAVKCNTLVHIGAQRRTQSLNAASLCLKPLVAYVTDSPDAPDTTRHV